jgi:hypothetical protein
MTIGKEYQEAYLDFVGLGGLQWNEAISSQYVDILE